MTVLVTGGSKSGKSYIAEKIISSCSSPKYYIATMKPYGEEEYEIISRHKKMREGKGFETIEKYTDMGEIILPEKSAVLIECICNLCANEMFSAHEKNPSEKILRDIKKLSENAEIFVAVTSQISYDGITYSEETEEYINQMCQLNRGLASFSDVVIESVFRIPFLLKGEKPPCL